jgi:putative membrane protein insertion efficiency factor
MDPKPCRAAVATALQKAPLSDFWIMRVILISLLKFYKAVISPWLPPSCRFVPTCSEYAREAIERHGALRGSGMAVWRLLRCQPFCVGGYDPVK